MGAFALQVYTFDEFNIQCHASFAARRKAIAAGEAFTQVPVLFAAAGSSAQARSAYRKGHHGGKP